MARELIKSDLTIRNLKPGAKRLNDGAGLYLLPFAKGQSHYWRFDYSYRGKRNTLSLGVYPDTTLAMAREMAQAYRTMVAAGQDPSETRKQSKKVIEQEREVERRVREGEPALGSFEEVGRRWFATRKHEWCESYSTKVLRRLELHAFPYIGHLPIGDIDPPKVLEVCRRVENNGTLETAHRVMELCSLIFRFAIAEGMLRFDPARDIRGALKKPVTTHFAAVTKADDLARVLRDIDAYQGTFVVRCALQLTPMVMVRPGELRLARWEEFDLDNGLWYVPSERLKRTKDQKENGDPHLVPLAPQAVAILEDLFSLTGRTGLVFPAEGRQGRCMSENTLNTAFRNMGYSTKEDVTAHGFRATARTLAVELLNFPEAVVEMQLAHVVKDENGTAYNRTEFLQKRFELMRAWADYLEALKKGRQTIQHPVLPTFTPVTQRLSANQSPIAIRA